MWFDKIQRNIIMYDILKHLGVKSEYYLSFF